MIFITGTDTGCGKTTVGRAIAAALRSRGLRVATFKPCETGCELDGDEERLIAADAEALAKAAQFKRPQDLLCPLRFQLSASPERAAAAESRTIDLDVILAAWKEAKKDVDFAIVEGAGGLLVPLTPSVMMADLPAMLDLPVLLVARDALGTVNHTLLSIEAIRARHLRLAGVVFSAPAPESEAESLHNVEAISQRGGFEILGSLPHFPDANDETLARAVEEHLNLDRLIQDFSPK